MPANTHDVLLEIGVEELPARSCPPALEQLKVRATAALAAARLAHGEIVTLGTPRPLVLMVRDLAARQADRDILSRGPATAWCPLTWRASRPRGKRAATALSRRARCPFPRSTTTPARARRPTSWWTRRSAAT